MIAIVDYGVGNVQAFLNAYKRLNVDAQPAATAETLRAADKIVLPGVGHFDHAMRRLNESGLRDTLDELVVQKRVPVLGVCVGMQMLAKSSDEGQLPGLSWIDAHVRGFDSWQPTTALPRPHMGWNDVRPVSPSTLFAELRSDARFYFLHSYFLDCAPAHVAAVAQYGGEFCAAVNADNVFGVQFHPEKSHHFGTRLLKNFADL
jgi:glutamine amidotransferase